MFLRKGLRFLKVQLISAGKRQIVDSLVARWYRYFPLLYSTGSTGTSTSSQCAKNAFRKSGNTGSITTLLLILPCSEGRWCHHDGRCGTHHSWYRTTATPSPGGPDLYSTAQNPTHPQNQMLFWIDHGVTLVVWNVPQLNTSYIVDWFIAMRLPIRCE